MTVNQQLFLKLLASNKSVRKIIASQIEKKIFQNLIGNTNKPLDNIKVRKFQWSRNLIRTVLKNYDKGIIAKESFLKLSKVIIEGAFQSNRKNYEEAVLNYNNRYGIKPPSFLVISPTKACNLNCYGCYANSSHKTKEYLSFDLLEKIIDDFYSECHGRFIVISGGEPLCYNDKGRTLLDIFEKYNDVFFMFFTNGTLINDEVAKRLWKVGNAVPCISVEGYENETNKRRGNGTFEKIHSAFNVLKEYGLPFCVSVTATEENKEILLSDRFYEYYFDVIGASYMWQFHLMPIGRGNGVFNLMPKPETRVQLFRVWERLLEKKGYCVADFWNSGMLTNGCIAYGRQGGYIYIDWNGKITPCVFVPFYVDTVSELYERGQKLGNALNRNFFKNGRKWQDNYESGKSSEEYNGLMPCSIRDHFKVFKNEILTAGAHGVDETADYIKCNSDYSDRLLNYDLRLNELTREIWDQEYVNNHHHFID